MLKCIDIKNKKSKIVDRGTNERDVIVVQEYTQFKTIQNSNHNF